MGQNKKQRKRLIITYLRDSFLLNSMENPFFLPPFKRKKLRLCWHQESDLPQRRQGVLSESITILILEEIHQLAERSGPATQCQDGYYVPYFLR